MAYHCLMNKAMLLKTAWKNSKTILGKKKKKNKIGELSLSSFKISYKVMVIKTVWYCIRIDIDHRQSLEFRNKPWPYGQLIFEKDARAI